MATNGNGTAVWRPWVLGILATLAVTLVTNGILFQRETKEKLSSNEERIKALEARNDRARETIIREFDRIEKRLDRVEQNAQPKQEGFKLQSENSRPFNPDEFK